LWKAKVSSIVPAAPAEPSSLRVRVLTEQVEEFAVVGEVVPAAAPVELVDEPLAEVLLPSEPDELCEHAASDDAQAHAKASDQRRNQRRLRS
jgi:hypothetical protein